MAAPRIARLTTALEPRLGARRALRYADGGSVVDDRPPFVRAASAVRRHRGRLVIVQDDVSVLAHTDDDGATEATLLPAGRHGLRTFDDARGNKHGKLDLEASVVLPDGRLVAFGSGSSPARTHVVVLDDDGVWTKDAAALYARLAEPGFAGAEPNVEGAVIVGDRVRFFQRGNGAPRAGRAPHSAIGDLPLAALLAFLDDGVPPPPLVDVRVIALPLIDGAPVGFTDACVLDDGRVAFVAAAERSPDVTRDGEVTGVCFGVFTDDDIVCARVVEHDGTPTRAKIEGIEPRRRGGAFDVVIDADAHDRPAEQAELVVRGLST